MLTSNYQDQAKKILEKWNYETIRRIGKGGFGHVVLASKFTNSMCFYAIKCISLKNSSKDPNLKKYAEQQVKTMCDIAHENVVRFENSFYGKHHDILDGGWYFIVMEYCQLGNLFSYQSKNSNKIFGLSEASKIFIQILDGIQAIHERNIIHRDLKCQNIFLKKNKIGTGYKCKIGDFGFARFLSETAKTTCGTTFFMAPQVLRNQPYSYEADIWSVGVIFYFMLFGEYPFKSLNIEKDFNDKCANGFALTDIPQNFKQRKQFVLVQDLFKRIFTLDQSKRIKLNQIRSHKLFKSNQCDGTEDSSFSDQQLEEELQFSLGKVKFVQDLIIDLTDLKILDPYLLHSARFYLYKILLPTFKHQNFIIFMMDQPKHKLTQQVQLKQADISVKVSKEYETLKKFKSQTKRINKFEQGYNLDMQDFYSIKQGYRNTIAAVYSDIQKKIGHEKTKAQLKLRVLCCHLINRVFHQGFKTEVFPNFHAWSKKNIKGSLKNEKQFIKFKEWINHESAQKLLAEIDNINKKFYN